MTILPGTDSATSLAVVLPDTVYFTRAGSSSVYRVALDSDSLMVAHVFTGIPVDLDVIGSRLAAVVSSQVVLVDLSTGGETVIGDSAAGWAHPALQPGGNHLVADYVNPDGTTDLWLLQLP
jgi:hypothetical protein